jgi:hypothetical protein
MTQALIVKDRFDNEAIADDLRKLLYANGITKIVEIPSLNNLEEAKILLNPKEPCLLYNNIFIRYNVPPSSILEFQKTNGFEVITLGNRLVSFTPGKTFKFENTISALNFIDLSKHSNFMASNLTTIYVAPKENPMLFIYSHNRDTYLKLTLNSLDFSLIQKIPIKILLNKPTDAVRQVALDFAKNKDYVEVLEAEENAFVTATNILVQYFRPEKFILMEDDYIYPPSVREYFPNWPFQFADRLNYFDVVGWASHADNIYNLYINIPRLPETQCVDDWEILTRFSKTSIMGQSLTLKTDHYIERTKIQGSEYVCAFDGSFRNSKRCAPSLKGYHVGFNQEMDGYPTPNQLRWPKPIEVCHVKSLTTGERKIINPKDLFN